MAQSVHSKDKKVYELLLKELQHVEALVRGHEKLLRAIAEL